MFKLVLIISDNVAICNVNIIYVHGSTLLVLRGSPLCRCQCSYLGRVQLLFFLRIVYISDAQPDPAELHDVVFLKTQSIAMVVWLASPMIVLDYIPKLLLGILKHRGQLHLVPVINPITTYDFYQ